MTCLAALFPFLMWLVVLIALAIIPPVVPQILNIIIWTIVAIALIYLVWHLLSCIAPLPFR